MSAEHVSALTWQRNQPGGVGLFPTSSQASSLPITGNPLVLLDVSCEHLLLSE